MARSKIVPQLSARLGGDWWAVRNGYGWVYVCSDGREVRAYSESMLGYDGYSDTDFVSVYLDGDGREVGRCGVIHSGRTL